MVRECECNVSFKKIIKGIFTSSFSISLHLIFTTFVTVPHPVLICDLMGSAQQQANKKTSLNMVHKRKLNFSFASIRNIWKWYSFLFKLAEKLKKNISFIFQRPKSKENEYFFLCSLYLFFQIACGKNFLLNPWTLKKWNKRKTVRIMEWKGKYQRLKALLKALQCNLLVQIPVNFASSCAQKPKSDNSKEKVLKPVFFDT